MKFKLQLACPHGRMATHIVQTDGVSHSCRPQKLSGDKPVELLDSLVIAGLLRSVRCTTLHKESEEDEGRECGAHLYQSDWYEERK